MSADATLGLLPPETAERGVGPQRRTIKPR